MFIPKILRQACLVPDEHSIVEVSCPSSNNYDLDYNFWRKDHNGMLRSARIINLNYIKPHMFELSEIIRELVGSGTTSSYDLGRYFPELVDRVFYQFTQER